MRIDSHQHFWSFDPDEHLWMTEEMSVQKRDFLPQDLASELASNTIDATIAVQARQSERETLFLLELAARHSPSQRHCWHRRLGEFVRTRSS
jgi:L-fuconolactonase